jgi:iron complex outermembrane receptor protein
MKNSFYILPAFLLLFSYTLSAQTLLDSAEVEAYRLKCPINQVAGAVHVVDSLAIHGFASSDLSRALNSIPGVKMETRGDGGSRRLNVRGSSLRSPYSVRNSMLIIDGFVFTEADGNSPIEWLDPDLVSDITVFTGPAAASYGGAYGGALIVNNNQNAQLGQHGWAHLRGAETGSGRDDGYSDLGKHLRASVGLSYGFEHGSINLTTVLTDNPGYRDWEWNNKQQVNLSANFAGSRGGVHTLVMGHFDGAWALPGSINQAQVDTLPTASSGIAYNAQVDRKRNIIGYKYELEQSSGWNFSASILGRITEKTNPYGTSPFYKGYKEEEGSGFSFLTSLQKRFIETSSMNLDFELTLMHISDELNLVEWEFDFNDYILAEPPHRRYDLDFTTSNTFISSSWVLSKGSKFRAEAQIGLSYRSRNTEGGLGIFPTPDEYYTVEYSNTQEFTTILPRLGFNYAFNDKANVFGQISTGFSDPTAFELIDPDTFTPAELESEASLGFELGIILNTYEAFEITSTFYNQLVDNAILQVTQENDAIAFENVDGGLSMMGSETVVVWHANDSLLVRGYASLTKYAFGNDTENAGNALPGTPDYSGGIQISSKLSWGMLNISARYVGETPLNNAATDVMEAYTVVDISGSKQIHNNATLEVGVRNMLDEKYSNWPQLNGVYGKYYNPAPPKTLYISLRAFI